MLSSKFEFYATAGQLLITSRKYYSLLFTARILRLIVGNIRDVVQTFLEFDTINWSTTTCLLQLDFLLRMLSAPPRFINVPEENHCVLLELLTSLPNGPLVKTDHLY